VTEPLRQAWVPRVVNVTLAAVLLGCLSPAVTRFGGHPVWVQVLLVLFCAPLLLLAVACLASAARPGSLGRLARKRRRARS
jgi:threonine/homoserine/homoserine lactone efflux protein